MKTSFVIVIQMLLTAFLSAQFEYPEKKPRNDQKLQTGIVRAWKQLKKDGYSRQLTFTNDGFFTDTVRTKDGSVKTIKGPYHIRNGELTMDYTKGKTKKELKYLFVDDDFKVEGDTLWLSKSFWIGGERFLKFTRIRPKKSG